jgi:hypothetical protein
MFSVITNIYNKKTKGPTLMEFFAAAGKLKKFFFWQLEMFDVCTTGDTAHIDTIIKLLPHMRQHVDMCVETTWISYTCIICATGNISLLWYLNIYCCAQYQQPEQTHREHTVMSVYS